MEKHQGHATAEVIDVRSQGKLHAKLEILLRRRELPSPDPQACESTPVPARKKLHGTLCYEPRFPFVPALC